MFKRWLFFAGFCIAALNMRTQIAGSFSVPATFPTIAAAINSLNVLGIAGSTTIHVAAGHTETAIPGGYKLFPVAGATSTSQIIFRKSGAGPNPLIVAYTGTATPASAVQDGVWWLIGADWITIDGIDILDPNVAGNAMMEFGYGLYKLNAANGCQHNTIRNCVITLSNNNGSSGGALVAGGSRGIEIMAGSYTLNTSAVSVTAASGSNSFNRIQSNLIRNCHVGIAFMGFASPSPYTNSDHQNEAGGTLAASGNTIINFGGASGSAPYGIRTIAQYSLSISYNLIDNNNGQGLDPVNTLMGIRIGPAPGSDLAVKNNTIAIEKIAASSLSFYGIYHDAPGASNGGEVEFSGNEISSFSNPNSSSGSAILMYINAISSVCKIHGNKIGNVQVNTSNAYMIYSTGTSSFTSISSNTISNFSATGTGNTYGILFSTALNYFVAGNLIDGIHRNAPGSGNIYAIYGTSTGTNVLINGNTVRDLTSGNGATIYGILSTGGTSGMKTLSGNKVYDVSASPGLANGFNFTGIYGHAPTLSLNVTANEIFSITSSGTNTTAANVISGIDALSAVSGTIAGNKIFGLANQMQGYVQGIRLQNGNYSIYNNLIGGFSAPFTTNTNGVTGISIVSGTTSASYNSIYLNANSNSGSYFGSSAVFAYTGALWSLKNNILVNTSVSTGTGITAVFRTSTSSIGNYEASSGYNLFYAGAPSASKVIYYNGSTTYSTLQVFKAFVTPREAQSVTELPPFLSSAGSSPNFLHIIPGIPTQIEGGATPVAGISVDYSGTPRHATTPDIGAREGNFTKADAIAPVVLTSGFTTDACNPSGRTYTAAIKDTSGVASGSLSPRFYYRVNFTLYSSVQGTLTAGSPTYGVWTFNINYVSSPGDVISHFLVAQDQSYLTNIVILPSSGASASDVNNIQVPPIPAATYTISTPPLISVNSGSICSGKNFTINPSGANTYSITGGSFVVSPVTNTSYSITGTSAAGCLSSNTAISNVTVVLSPVVSMNSGSLCSGQSYTLVPSGATSYSFSGGSAVVSPVVTSVYTVTGSNSQGCTAIANATVTVQTTPTISANSGSICAGQTFTIVPSGASSYSITGGSYLVSPSVPATYTVNGSSAGCAAAAVIVNVNVSPLPTITVNSGSICSGQVFTIQASGAISYTYSSGSATVSPNATSTYSVIGTGSGGCISSGPAIVSVAVIPGPSVSITGPSAICAGSTVSLVATGAQSYTWNTGTQSAVLSVTPPVGVSNYSVTGSDSNGCNGSANKSVNVGALPILTISGNTVLCNGKQTSLLATGTAISYSWNTGSVSPLITIAPQVTTTYTVTGTGVNSCVNTIAIQVVVHPLPSVSAIASSTSVCNNGTVVLAGQGASSYNWTGGIGNNTPFQPQTSADYTVTGTDGNGCMNSSTLHVSVLPSPLIVISASNDSVCAGTTVTLTAAGADTYTWTYTGGSSIAPTITVTPGSTTIYTVIGLASDVCEGAASKIVTAVPCNSIGKETDIYGKIHVFPNPFQNTINVETELHNRNLTITIMSVIGQKLFYTVASSDVNQIGLEGLKPGIYLLSVNHNKTVIFSERIVRTD